MLRFYTPDSTSHWIDRYANLFPVLRLYHCRVFPGSDHYLVLAARDEEDGRYHYRQPVEEEVAGFHLMVVADANHHYHHHLVVVVVEEAVVMILHHVVAMVPDHPWMAVLLATR